MKKHRFLFYIPVLCGFLIQYHAFAGKGSPAVFTYTSTGYRSSDTSNQDQEQIQEQIVVGGCGVSNPCAMGTIPKRPGTCICEPAFLFRRGKRIWLMYKAVGKEKALSVPFTVTNMSAQFAKTLNNGMRVSVNRSAVQQKGKGLQLDIMKGTKLSL